MESKHQIVLIFILIFLGTFLFHLHSLAKTQLVEKNPSNPPEAYRLPVGEVFVIPPDGDNGYIKLESDKSFIALKENSNDEEPMPAGISYWQGNDPILKGVYENTIVKIVRMKMQGGDKFFIFQGFVCFVGAYLLTVFVIFYRHNLSEEKSRAYVAGILMLASVVLFSLHFGFSEKPFSGLHTSKSEQFFKKVKHELR